MRFCVRVGSLVFVAIFIAAVNAGAQTEQPKRNWITLYGGPSTAVSLMDIVRFTVPKFENRWAITAGMGHELRRFNHYLGLEMEGDVSKYLDNARGFSVSGAIIMRWLDPPWRKLFGGTFAFGNGLSYANRIPEVEAVTIPKSARLLYHLLIEYEFSLTGDQAWNAIFRVHHRSGAFGVFDGVVGGSDFLCLGLKYRF